MRVKASGNAESTGFRGGERNGWNRFFLKVAQGVSYGSVSGKWVPSGGALGGWGGRLEVGGVMSLFHREISIGFAIRSFDRILQMCYGISPNEIPLPANLDGSANVNV